MEILSESERTSELCIRSASQQQSGIIASGVQQWCKGSCEFEMKIARDASMGRARTG